VAAWQTGLHDLFSRFLKNWKVSKKNPKIKPAKGPVTKLGGSEFLSIQLNPYYNNPADLRYP